MSKNVDTMLEVSYYAHTHKSNKIAQSILHKINGVIYKEKLSNLAILVHNDTVGQYTMTGLPTNLDVNSILVSKRTT